MTARTPTSQMIHDVFAVSAAQHAGKAALKFGGSEISYRQLAAAADYLSGLLVRQGVKRGDIVALLMPRSPELIAAMLAVLKCGAAYLPLDVDGPVTRNLGLLAEAQVDVLMLNQDCADDLRAGRKLVEVNSDTIFSDAVRQSRQSDLAAVQADPEDKAYVMYTSGSTGGPKGVVVPHRAIYRLVQSPNYIHITPDDNILHVAATEFDAATFEVWGALLNGATLIIYPEKTLDPNLFVQVVRDNKVTMMFLTSALFHLFAAKYPDAFDTVKFLLAGGDIISPTVVNGLLDAQPDITIINCYGPTENTTFTTTHGMTTGNRPGATVPIGKAISGTALHILDSNKQPVPAGQTGELFTSGSGVALGYLDPARNKDAFFIDQTISEGLIYRTGDLVRANNDGTLEFIGRKDNQVKVRGFRMSLEEVLSPLLELDEVIEAAVTVKKHASGDQQLIAFVQLRPKIKLKVSDIKHKLAAKVPAYMVPDSIYLDVELLINKNGKIDKKKMQEMLAC